MAKVIGKAKIINVEEYTRKDGTKGFRLVAITPDNQPIVFYRPAEELPKIGEEYELLLGYDSKLSAVVRYQKVNA